MGGKSAGMGAGIAAALGGVALSIAGAPEIGVPMIMGGVGSATGAGFGGGKGAMMGGLSGAGLGAGIEAGGGFSGIGSALSSLMGGGGGGGGLLSSLGGLFGSGGGGASSALDPQTALAMGQMNPAMSGGIGDALASMGGDSGGGLFGDTSGLMSDAQSLGKLLLQSPTAGSVAGNLTQKQPPAAPPGPIRLEAPAAPAQIPTAAELTGQAPPNPLASLQAYRQMLGLA
jgi:hypothetical protein